MLVGIHIFLKQLPLFSEDEDNVLFILYTILNNKLDYEPEFSMSR